MHLRNEEGAYIEEMKSLTRGRWIVNESEWMCGCGCSRVLHLGEHFICSKRIVKAMLRTGVVANVCLPRKKVVCNTGVP